MPPDLDLALRPEPAFLLLAALALDAVAGDPLGRAHPVALLGRLVAGLERRLNRAQRSAATRQARGVLTVLVVVGTAVAAGLLVRHVALNQPWGWLLEVAFVATLLAQKSLAQHVARVRAALLQGGLAAGRQAVAHIVGRDPETLDHHAVARAAIESCAENFADGVVAPAFWYAVAGPAGIAAYKAINTLDSMIGHRSERYRDFGRAAARLDDAANLVPARLAGLLLAAAAVVVPGASPARAVRAMLRDAGKHLSPNAGWPEAAVAGALGLALGGPRSYGGAGGGQAWMGDGRARAMPNDIRSTLYLYAVACLLLGGLVALWLAAG